MHFKEQKEDARILQSFTIQSFVLFMAKSGHTKVIAAHTSAALYDTTIQVRLLQILQLLRYIQTEGEMGTCFSLMIVAPEYCMTAGMLSVYQTLRF